MRKYAAFFILFSFCALGAGARSVCAQAAVPPAASAKPETAEITVTRTEPGAVATKSSIVPKIDSKLSDAVLLTSVMDYSLPEELLPVAKKCAAGESDECYFSYKSFENAPDKKTAAAANLELAVLSVQRGLVKQALKYADKAAALNPDDPYIQLVKGWTLLSAGKYKKARKAFADLMYLTADIEYVASAKLGTALAYYYGKDKEKAALELQYLYTSYPYTISFVSAMLGQIASEMKSSRDMAPIFLQQALTHDNRNYAAAELQAKLSAKKKERLRAWQYYATLYTLDPDNKDLAKKVAKYAKDLGDKSKDYLFYLRLDMPIAGEIPSTASEEVKMALYADRNARPVPLRAFSVLPSGGAQVTDEKLGSVLKIPSFSEKRVEFNAENGSVDFKDARGHVEFSTRRPFTVTSDNVSRTLLVKGVVTENLFAADLSDKELSGSLTVLPGPDGMTLVNNVRAEDLVPALLATQAQDIKEGPALTALAVVFRSALLDAVEASGDKPYHITDNDPYFKFKGVNLVVTPQLEASKQSSGIRLKDTELGYYANCGVVAADGLENTEQKPGYVFSPANAGKYMISNPPADLFSKPEDPTLWSGVKWMYAYDGKEIAKRVAYKQDIGKLRALEPLKRTSEGRILSMKFEGSKGVYVAQTPQEISFLLSAGTLRSNFFELIPLYKGKHIKTLLVRGYDTGNGVGLCLQGADGLAKRGADFKGIIKYYFPDARILNTQTGIIN